MTRARSAISLDRSRGVATSNSENSCNMYWLFTQNIYLKSTDVCSALDAMAIYTAHFTLHSIVIKIKDETIPV